MKKEEKKDVVCESLDRNAADLVGVLPRFYGHI
ncbi:hypothetical protein MMIC_P2423 [Mariprofundus micogutta]|uniref:Uncharacterized protein n=1 Tax=Mariprofundus micogutta TaxID=1921010 RepID=A0A1L8CRD5_9PROT|nr:hypothetical protein MMIC_P2423 [Mariprofundus micogutta]